MNDTPTIESPAVQSPPSPGLFSRMRGWWNDGLNQWQTWLDRAQNLTRSNFELGKEMVRRDKINDAIFRFRMTTWLDPKHVQAWFNLGCCYVTMGKMDKAAAAFRKVLELEPNHEETKFMLASSDPTYMSGQPPKFMPLSLVTSQFEVLAPEYNNFQLADLGYSGHNLIYKAVADQLHGKNNNVILELGCGTGLCGMLFRRIKSRMTGVDVSTAMLARATDMTGEDGSEIYDELIQEDILTYLRTQNAPVFDVIFAANVFNYVGDLEEIFQRCKAALKPGGLFAFTAEYAHPPGYRLIPGAAQYGHSVDYLRNLTGSNALEELKTEEILIYNNHRAQLCVLRKPG